MTVEEYFEEWWTQKELPESGFNNTAMLDFAEMYHNQALRIHDVIKSVCVHPYEKVYQSETECYCEICGHDFTEQTVL